MGLLFYNSFKQIVSKYKNDPNIKFKLLLTSTNNQCNNQIKYVWLNVMNTTRVDYKIIMYTKRKNSTKVWCIQTVVRSFENNETSREKDTNCYHIYVAKPRIYKSAYQRNNFKS